MGLLTINGATITSGTIKMPRVGIWHADISVDSETDIAGAATITTDDKSFSLVGIVQRHGIYEGRLGIRVIGGAGGFGTVIPPRAYRNATVGLVLRDILTPAGEAVAAATDAAFLSRSLPAWVRIAGTAGQALQRLLEPYDVTYRMQPDGKLWVGADTFPAAPAVTFDVIDRDFGMGRMTIASQYPFLLPGTTLTVKTATATTTRKVSYIVHTIQPGSVRSSLWFEKVA